MSDSSVSMRRVLLDRLSAVAPPQYQIQVGGAHSRMTYRELVVEKIIESALGGKQWAAELIAAYSDGKPGTSRFNDQQDDGDRERIDELLQTTLNAYATSITKNRSGDATSAAEVRDAPVAQRVAPAVPAPRLSVATGTPGAARPQTDSTGA